MKLLKAAAITAAAALLLGCASSEPEFPPGPALFVARDADSTMYLFGTLHIRQPGTPWGGARSQAGLADADEVWTELIISPETDAQTQSLALQHGLAPPGRPLSSWLSTEENARLSAVAQSLGMPASALEPMQPWLASLTLTVLPMVRAGFDPNAGADRQIDAFGDANGKRMRAFETAAQQIEMLAGLDDNVQRQMLLEAIEQAESGNAEIESLAAAWESGDLATLEDLAVTQLRDEFPEFYDVLLARRNRAWVLTLTAELEGSGVDFVAVGAGHMLGEDGLVAQLRARGYQVERVE
jgi:uncharacterized protein YbaP (TraB family)